MSPVIIFQLNTLNTAKAPAVDLLRLNTLRGTKTAVLTPKGYNEPPPPSLLYGSVPPRENYFQKCWVHVQCTSCVIITILIINNNLTIAFKLLLFQALGQIALPTALITIQLTSAIKINCYPVDIDLNNG